MSAPVVDEAYKLKRKENNGMVYAFYWHISMFLSKGLRAMGIHPNMVSLSSLIFFIAGGYSFYQGTYEFTICGAFFFFLGVLMDCTDGKLARMTLKTSNLGIWLDYNIDYIKPLFIYPPIALAMFRETGSMAMILLAFIALAVILVLAMIDMRWRQFPFAAETKENYIKTSKYHRLLKQFYFLEGMEPIVAVLFAFLGHIEYYLVIWTVGTTMVYLVTTFTLGAVIAKNDKAGRA